jgi:hypothetical protein
MHKKQLGLAALGAAAAGVGFMLAGRKGQAGRAKRRTKQRGEA